jgi:hypothetical protein
VQLLRMQRPPLTPADFEESIRKQLTVEKLRSSLTEWLSVADTDLEQEYRRRNDKVKLAVVTLTADSLRGQVTASDADVASYFDAHKEEFKIPEKRKIRYLLVDIDALRAKVVVPAAEIERAYNNSVEQYSTPEQVRASHILLKTEGKDDATVKAKAEQLLKQAKAGADFADLAKKNSEDEASAKNGGDLDYFGRGRMVPEFDQAAFAMQTGQISDLVKTQYGYHIIKLTDKKTATTRPLAEVRQLLGKLREGSPSASGALPRRRRPARRKRPRSSSTASRPTAGASSSARTRMRSIVACARRRSAPTTSISSRNSRARPVGAIQSMGEGGTLPGSGSLHSRVALPGVPRR